MVKMAAQDETAEINGKDDLYDFIEGSFRKNTPFPHTHRGSLYCHKETFLDSPQIFFDLGKDRIILACFPGSPHPRTRTVLGDQAQRQFRRSPHLHLT